MRHRKAYSKLNRDKDHRKALKRNQLRALFKYEKIVTTVTKAKLLRIHADKIITLAKKGDVASRRLVLRDIPDKELVHKIFSEIAPRFEKREGGYTRVLRYKDRRGDGAPMAVVELVQEELKVHVKRKKLKEEQKKKDEKKTTKDINKKDKQEESVEVKESEEKVENVESDDKTDNKSDGVTSDNVETKEDKTEE